jgi:hypothetical protein
MHPHTIKQIAKSVTDRPITDLAIFVLSMKTEDWVKKVVKDAEALLEERNNLRAQQSLSKKQKITDELIMEVLNNNER